MENMTIFVCFDVYPVKDVKFSSSCILKLSLDFATSLTDWMRVVFFSDALGNTLAAHVDKPRVYMGCMKSGEVFSEPWVKLQ